MFILKVNYKKPIEEVERFLAAHRQFLDQLYAQGMFIASGPQEPRTGGVILCNAATVAEATAIYQQDPFYTNGIADYELTQFHVTKHNVDNFTASFE
ncbi:MAG: GTP cyclohydrolase [Bacteroidales bacterium]|nr:GTP cyclohydrolase [Bacteroidales bacterium]